MVNWSWGYRLGDIESKNIKKLLSQQKDNEVVFSRVDILLMVAQNPTIHSIF